MSVYFAQRGDLIKIGHSTDPERRATQLKARLLAVMPGELRMERVMHGLFSAYQVEGEWFRPGLKLGVFIEALCGDDCSLDIAWLPEAAPGLVA